LKHFKNRQLGGFKFRRQEVIGQYFVYFEAKSIIEIDGGQNVNQEDVYDKHTEVFKSHGHKVLHLLNDDILVNTDDVISDIMRKLDTRSCIVNIPSPQPSPGGRGGAAIVV